MQSRLPDVVPIYFESLNGLKASISVQRSFVELRDNASEEEFLYGGCALLFSGSGLYCCGSRNSHGMDILKGSNKSYHACQSLLSSLKRA